jgi:hypothetical protein
MERATVVAADGGIEKVRCQLDPGKLPLPEIALSNTNQIPAAAWPPKF